MCAAARRQRSRPALRTLPRVELLRIGTRAPVTLPMRIDDELCRMLEQGLGVCEGWGAGRLFSAESRRAGRLLNARGRMLSPGV